MKNSFAGIVEDESGLAAPEHGLITIVLPILFIVLLIAVGISMVTGTPLLKIPGFIGAILDASLSLR